MAFDKDKKGGQRRNDKRPERVDDGLIKNTISIRRVTKVTKGGKTMKFSALVAVGDGAGSVGIGIAKGAEVPMAIERATNIAKREMFKVATYKTTIPHATIGLFGAGKVVIMPAAEGTGVIAGGAVRKVLEASGIKDIRTKTIGTNNAINSAKAIIEGLKTLRTAKEIAKVRGLTVGQVIGKEEVTNG
ncbi:MAG: 30S ribosomal protein S5 [Christensenellaceae bacterium]|jgi:small subunit ribosomal protein S5|nr:30S ribosomal protein S5 [Christensenellaceae bacterium]